MDISIIFSVGSFMMSEHVLKPKSSLLCILGCVLAYDLTTKTHDSSSLRVYRGPALLGFTLMMCAYSLRTWRRNGVACDELIFLPGTLHGQRHGSDTGTSESSSNHGTSAAAFRRAVSSPAEQPTTNTTTVTAAGGAANEGDAAAGFAPPSNKRNAQKSSSALSPRLSPQSPGARSTRTAPPSLELTAMTAGGGTAPGDAAAAANTTNTNQNRTRTASRSESSISSIQAFSDSWDEDDDDEADDNDIIQNDAAGDEERAPLTRSVPTSSAALQQQQQQRGNATPTSGGGGGHSSSSSAQDAVTRFSENHPRITRIGTLFFFRSSVASECNATYAPSGPMVFGGALDLCMPTLFNFHLFTEACNHIDQYGSDFPAKILPICFLTILLGRLVFPPGKRGRFWGTLKYTFMAPFSRSRFRDVFIGDVLTSFVRPGQDILFALSYYITTMRGMISGEYGLSDSGAILESSWLLHNVVLPSAALLPLWWRFLQCLRQCYDSGQRWPHLGNAFKYLTASLVILYGMTHPEDRRSPWWIVSFALCVMYQLWWDVVMDWDLLVIAPRGSNGEEKTINAEGQSFLFHQTSSYQGDSYILPLRMLIWQPIKDAARCMYTKIPRLSQIQLRKRRLYKTEAFYWRILCYNVVFRFTWMLCFIPAYRLSASGVEHVTTFSSDTNSYVGVLLPVAELLRRTFWGFLLLEKETIRMQDEDPTYSRILSRAGSTVGGMDDSGGLDDIDNSRRDNDIMIIGESSDGDIEMASDSENSSKMRYVPTWLASTLQHQQEAATMSSSRCRCPPSSSSVLVNVQQKLAECLDITDNTKHQLFTAELTVWAMAFIMLGLWATT